MSKYYTEFCMGLMKPGEEIVAEITPNKAEVLHMAVGVSGEAGELLDAIKKHTMYNKELDYANVVEELGDIEFYLEGLRTILNISREEVIRGNVEKLSKRYSSGKFSNQQAQDRADKGGE